MRRKKAIRFRFEGALLLAALAVVGMVAASVGAAESNTAPANTGEPRILGTPVVDSTLTTSNGTWTGTQPLTFTYSWLRCPKDGGTPTGSNCGVISGATKSTYQVRSADVGFRIRSRVRATNASGSAAATSNATAIVTPSTQGQPRNTSAPTISGTPAAQETLRATPGTWTGTQPITYSFQWLRCDEKGNNCLTLTGFSDDSYTLRDGDIGKTVRVRVTARNSVGTSSKLSAPTGVVQQAAGPPGAIKLPSGEISIPATSVTGSARLVVQQVQFSPNPVRSRSQPITIRIRVKDSRGYVVRDALVFERSTPLVTSTPAAKGTEQDGWVTYTVQPESDFPIKNGYNVQFFVKAYRAGDPVLGGIAGYRLVQVATAR